MFLLFGITHFRFNESGRNIVVPLCIVLGFIIEMCLGYVNVDSKISVDHAVMVHTVAWEICLTLVWDQGSFGCVVCLNQAC
jgi:membrane protease YdiL (CAAX protease family)